MEPQKVSSVRHEVDKENSVPANPRPVKVGLAAALASIPKQTRLRQRLDSSQGQDQSASELFLQMFDDVVRDVCERLPWVESPPKKEGGIRTGMTKRKRGTKTKSNLERKFGVSLTSVRTRTGKERQHDLTQVQQLLDENGTHALIRDEHADKAMALNPPGLFFHESSLGLLRLIIKLQLAEMACACICASNDCVCERLPQMPSRGIRSAMTEHEFCAPAIREGKRLLVDSQHSHSHLQSPRPRKVMSLTTWPHMGVHLQSARFLETMDPGTQALIKERTRPDEDEFVTNLKHREIWTGFDQTCQDLVEEAGRVTQDLKPLAAELETLLASDESSKASATKVKQCISSINKGSQNHSHHKDPTKKEWSNALEAFLSQQLTQDVPTTTIIAIEGHSLENLERDNPALCEDFLTQKILVHEATNLWLIKSKTGHAILSCHTPFVAHCDISSTEQRFSGIRRQLAVQDCLAALGLVSKASVERLRAMGTTFLMGLAGSFQAAHCSVLPSHCCGGNKRDILCTSGNIGVGIGHLETLFLRCALGRTKFERLLRIFGMCAGPEALSPLELEFRCPGCAAAGNLPARASCCSAEDKEVSHCEMWMAQSARRVHPGVWT